MTGVEWHANTQGYVQGCCDETLLFCKALGCVAMLWCVVYYEIYPDTQLAQDSAASNEYLWKLRWCVYSD